MDGKNELDQKFVMMTETPVESLVLKMAAPTIVSMLISSIYNMADTYFVGKINTSATAAVGVAFALMAMIQAVGFFFGHGSGNYISRALGSQDVGLAGKMASIGFFSSILGGLVIAVCGLLFLKPFALALGATETILPYACDYMRYILLGAPYMTAALTLNNQLRFQGSTFYAMIGITSGGIINMCLDPLFIFVFHMGVSGAALATIVSQLISFILLLLGVMRKGIPVKIRNFKPNRYFYGQILQGGSPSLARQGCGSLATLFLNHMAGAYGDAAIAAMSIVTKITIFAGSALIGFGQGFQPVCGFNYGAKLYDRVKRAFWFCVKSSFLVLLLIAVLGMIFAPQIVSLFRRDDAEVIRIGAIALRWQCITFPTIGFTVLANMMAQTIGKAVKATILALSRQFLFLIPALFFLSRIFGLAGIARSQAVADVCSVVISIPICFSIFREMKAEDGIEGAVHNIK